MNSRLHADAKLMFRQSHCDFTKLRPIMVLLRFRASSLPSGTFGISLFETTRWNPYSQMYASSNIATPAFRPLCNQIHVGWFIIARFHDISVLPSYRNRMEFSCTIYSVSDRTFTTMCYTSHHSIAKQV